MQKDLRLVRGVLLCLSAVSHLGVGGQRLQVMQKRRRRRQGALLALGLCALHAHPFLLALPNVNEQAGRPVLLPTLHARAYAA